MQMGPAGPIFDQTIGTSITSWLQLSSGLQL
jgi:hypothetical protein